MKVEDLVVIKANRDDAIEMANILEMAVKTVSGMLRDDEKIKIVAIQTGPSWKRDEAISHAIEYAIGAIRGEIYGLAMAHLQMREKEELASARALTSQLEMVLGQEAV